MIKEHTILEEEILISVFLNLFEEERFSIKDDVFLLPNTHMYRVVYHEESHNGIMDYTKN